MSNKYKRGDTWYIRYYENGKKVVRSLKTSNEKIAEKIKIKIDANVALGRHGIGEEKKKVITLSAFFALYFTYVESFKKESTLRNERNYVKLFTAFVGDVDIRDLDAQMLDMWKAVMLKTHSPVTFNIRRRFLHASFNIAVKWKYLVANPMSDVAKVKVEQKRLYMTQDEIQKVLTILDQDIANPEKKHFRRFNVLFRQFVVFLLLTGLRKQEAIDLTKENINFTDEVIYITNTKGKKDRVIPLHPRAKEILTHLNDKLFKPCRPGSVSHKFKMLCKRAGVSSDFKVHSLRHSFGTLLNEKGVDISVIQNLLGHSDIRTTLIYSKVTVQKLKNDILKLDVPKTGID